MFEGFSLPDVASVSRRTVVGALVLGVVGLIVCLFLSAALVGLGFCVGLGLGIVNFRLIQRSVVRAGEREEANRRRPLALNTAGRLGVISVIALGLMFVSFDLGLGLLAGLALFQALLLANVARSMFKMGHIGPGAFRNAIDANADLAGELKPVEVPDDSGEGV